MQLHYLKSAFDTLDANWQRVFTNVSSLLMKIDDYLLHSTGHICPKKEDIFTAFKYTSLDSISTLILGQDPYHTKGVANGLAFSVNQGVKLPPSLRNIFLELKNEYGIETDCYDGALLYQWAKSGVLLLNSSLTVFEGSPNSMSNIGWTELTDFLIKFISMYKKRMVFILWGNYARQKIQFIDTSKHLVLQSSHPSPFSARYSFFGCKHFIQCNNYLMHHGIKAVKWC